MKINILTAGAIAVAMGLCSCSTQRSPLTYFENIDSVKVVSFNEADYMPKVEPDDELYVLITSSQPEATAAYNLPLSNPAVNANKLMTSSPQQMTYIVDSKGQIDIPLIGKLTVQGLTTEQVADIIEAKVKHDVEDPVVVVKLLNFKVNVAGEVKEPGAIPVTNQRFSVLDALTAAGDLTEYGERNNVLLIREENGKREAHRLNLNSADILTSPYFFVKQNDYIYVAPNKIRQDNSKYNQNNAYKVTVISTIVSAASVVASLVIALTVK